MLILGHHILNLDKKMCPDVLYVVCDYPHPTLKITSSAVLPSPEDGVCFVARVWTLRESVSSSWPRYTVSSLHPVRLHGQRWGMP